ncbi:peptidase MA family metallohydrolase [Chloroflexota bacterium]
MIKKAGLVVVTALLFLLLLIPGSVQASSELTVVDSSAKVDFPASLSFHLSAASNVFITDIRLHYRVERLSYAPVTSEVYLEFAPDTVVESEWVWDMRKTGGLPPGAGVTYWWKVEDAAGNKIRTELSNINFNDNRYTWNEITGGKVTLHWYRGSDSYIEELMEAVQQTLVRLREYTNVELEKSVNIHIYANASDLQGAMIYSQEWTGGLAFTRYGIIAVGIEPNRIEWGSRVLAHELTHLVIHQMTLSPYGDIPTWLDEGLAMNGEGDLRPTSVSLLNDAALEDNLISVRSMASPFSAYTAESSLAYAQSYSLVEFLSKNYGQEKMFELLSAFQEGSSYDDALLGVYGFDMDGLDSQWRDYIIASVGSADTKWRVEPQVWLFGLLVFGLVVIAIVVIVLWQYGRRGDGRL